MILFKNVSKIYPGSSVALQDASFRIRPREFVSIVGRSGAGKSTILKLLMGEERPTSGQIFFDKEDITHFKSHEFLELRRKIGAVFQDFKLLSSKTTYENVAYVMEVMGRPEKEIEEDVPQVLKLVGLKDKANNFPHALSGGEKQRVAFARALIHRPAIVIADEPTGNLDYFHTWDIIKLLVKINELGTSVILATHDKDIVDTLKRRVITLDKGKVIADEEKGKYII